MDTALALSISLLAAAMAAAVILVAFAQARLVQAFALLSRSHREDMRNVMNYAQNTSRVYQNEFLRLGVRATVPDIDASVTRLHDQMGGDRADAVRQYLASLEANGHDPS
jgi:hypothetical protein